MDTSLQDLSRIAVKNVVPKRANGAMVANLNRGAAGRLFRRLCREMMIEDDIMALVRKRIIAELRGDLGQDGKPVDVKVTPVVMKIAGYVVASKGELMTQYVGPSIHVHMEKLSDQELEDYVTKGIRPPSLQVASVEEHEEG